MLENTTNFQKLINTNGAELAQKIVESSQIIAHAIEEDADLYTIKNNIINNLTQISAKMQLDIIRNSKILIQSGERTEETVNTFVEDICAQFSKIVTDADIAFEDIISTIGVDV
ncbi:MAG: hypothetical protein LBM38_00390 [Clostridiales bacterium]|jgi:hypothetical protein|nr:hypothetical protein [Clostridiales bacterium]